MAYSTKQHQAMLRCLERRGEEPLTAAALAEDLRQSGSPMGLATVYRQLEKLEHAGMVHKINTGESALYQYCPHRSEGHHDCLPLRCESCGRIDHLDCSHFQHLYDHLEAAHHFRINSHRTILTGLCRVCSEKEAQYGSI